MTLNPLDPKEKKDPNFDESALKGELGWISAREVWYDTMLAIRYSKTQVSRALKAPRYECGALAIFAQQKELMSLQLETYEMEKKRASVAGTALFIRNAGNEGAVAAEQYLIDHFERLVKMGKLGRVNVLKLMEKGKWDGPGRLFDRPGT